MCYCSVLSKNPSDILRYLSLSSNLTRYIPCWKMVVEILVLIWLVEILSQFFKLSDCYMVWPVSDYLNVEQFGGVFLAGKGGRVWWVVE